MPESGPDEAGARVQRGVGVALAELVRLRIEARRLDLAPRGMALATRSGGHLARYRGRGIEVDESRVYVPGDDRRSMDWRVTARTGVPHVKVYREERERPVWLLVDQGPAMRFGTRVAFKSVVAARVAALLGWAAVDRGDRVGGLVFDERRRVLQLPRMREHGLLTLLRALAERTATGVARGCTGVGDAAGALAQLARPGSLIFVVSDLGDVDPDRGSAWLARLVDIGETTLIAIQDPLEAQPPPPGRWPVTDGRRRRLLDTSTPGRRGLYLRLCARRRQGLEDLALRLGAHLLVLSTDLPTGPALARGLGRPVPARGGGRR